MDRPISARVDSPLTPQGTNIHAPLTLQGEVHPVFQNWIIPNDNAEAEALSYELHQPLLLASRILETVGLPWLSEFCIDDIFAPCYPGHNVSAKALSTRRRDQKKQPPTSTPEVIVRHHRASWITPHLTNTWLSATAHELRTRLPRSIQWQLDPNIFSTFGWVGYTCRRSRHRGTLLTVDDMCQDRPNAIAQADRDAKAEGAMTRCMTILVMKEYASRLHMLRQLGRLGDEEYLFTAFMAAVTLLHE